MIARACCVYIFRQCRSDDQLRASDQLRQSRVRRGLRGLLALLGLVLADNFLLSVLNGRLRENVVHFRTVAQAVAALKEGSVAAVMETAPA